MPPAARTIGILVLTCSSSVPVVVAQESHWGPLHLGACAKDDGVRHVWAEFIDSGTVATAGAACELTTRNVMGLDSVPARCEPMHVFGFPRHQVRGEWDVLDSRCRVAPPDSPVPEAPGSPPSAALEGYADVHAHQMVH